MKNKLWIVPIFVVVILVLVVMLGNRKNNLSSTSTFSTKTSDENAVVVEVTPKVLSDNQPASFQMAFDTHSVPLEFDLLKVSKLTDDQGNIYQPVSWSGGSGGHHLSGILTFPKIGNVKSIELIVTGVAGVDRIFKWEIAR
ncbi:hypothetical protein HY385_01290 [Candidatus Daviesbacteria bacterium]|nr:hypothetical protein [Candidatus Daviesbacteria bacterium]